MANTEIRKTLQYVREAENEVTAALQQSGLTQSQRDLLDELADALRDLDNQLVLDDVNTSTAALEEKAKQMLRLNQDTREKLKELQKITETVEKVAKAVNGLVKVFGILAKAGLA
ncbi:MAG: hypothetical protein A2075_15215 [Geobacteraceae bacterium GWC2_58_44]|nr:MAG: hypothetical protein A2075_15215 [Geobacteraceae bacterium GWC2_58_44]HBG07302.1 hypothetical protein [Geobacter sp.]